MRGRIARLFLPRGDSRLAVRCRRLRPAGRAFVGFGLSAAFRAHCAAKFDFGKMKLNLGNAHFPEISKKMKEGKAAQGDVLEVLQCGLQCR